MPCWDIQKKMNTEITRRTEHYTGSNALMFLSVLYGLFNKESPMPMAGHPKINENAWSAAITANARPTTLDLFTKEEHSVKSLYR
jgi:hypothetical protein